VEKGRNPECMDGVVGRTRLTGGVDVVWAETRRRRRGQSERAKEERERRRDRSDLYRTCNVGGGATPKRNAIT